MKQTRCGLRMVTPKSRPGRAGGDVCEVATVRAWKESEVKRLSVRVLRDSGDAARIVAEVVGTDLTVKEHIVLIGLDARNRVVSIADGSSHQRSLCMFRAIDVVGAVAGSALGKVVAVVMGHNHPGGDPHASPEDIKTAERFQIGFQGASLVDSVIVSHASEKDNPRAWVDRSGPITGLKHFSMLEEYGEALFKSYCKA